MPFVSFANTALVELVYQCNSVVCENTLYFRGGTPWSTSSLNDLGTAVWSWWSSQLKPLQGATLQLTEIKCRDMSTQFGAYGGYVPVSGNVGTRVSPTLPNNVTVAIKFTTTLVGRRNRGRNFFVGLCEDQVGVNNVNTADAAAIVSAYEELLVTAWPNSANHVVASRATAEAPSWTGVTTLITGYSVDPRIDTQRRRLS